MDGRRTKTDHNSSPWAFSSGELKMPLKYPWYIIYTIGAIGMEKKITTKIMHVLIFDTGLFFLAQPKNDEMGNL